MTIALISLAPLHHFKSVVFDEFTMILTVSNRELNSSSKEIMHGNRLRKHATRFVEVSLEMPHLLSY
jgi:hypothetical protein